MTVETETENPDFPKRVSRIHLENKETDWWCLDLVQKRILWSDTKGDIEDFLRGEDDYTTYIFDEFLTFYEEKIYKIEVGDYFVFEVDGLGVIVFRKDHQVIVPKSEAVTSR